MDDKTAIEILGSIRRDLDQEGETSVLAIQHAIQAIEALGKVRVEIRELRTEAARHLEIDNVQHANTLDSIADVFDEALGKQEG
jgi:hypothetical protein